MHIDHPLWRKCGLRQQARVYTDLQMMTHVRKHIESMRLCDDLTPNELSLLDALQAWLDNENAKYEV